MAACETCGYQFASPELVEVDFDEDVESTAAMLERDPLVALCRNCGSPVVVAVAAAFLDRDQRFASCLVHDASGERLVERLRATNREGWRFEVASRPEDLASSVRAHLTSVAAQVDALWERQSPRFRRVSPKVISDLIESETASMPSRAMLNALGVLGGERKERANELAPMLALRNARISLADAEDATVSLDAAVGAWLVDTPAVVFLLQLGMSAGATLGIPPPGVRKPPVLLLEQAVAPLLAGAWACDRRRAGYPAPGPTLWATAVVVWLHERPDAAASLGPNDFLLRTVDNVQVANMTFSVLAKEPTDSAREALVSELERRGLFGGIDFVAHVDRIMHRAESDP